MDYETGRYNHIEDVLSDLHPNAGCWFHWENPETPESRIYAELLIMDDRFDKPTEKSLTDALAKHQSDFDAQEYARNRTTEYPSNGDQWDMIYKDNKNSTTTHADAVEAVKTKWPKDNSGPVE